MGQGSNSLISIGVAHDFLIFGQGELTPSDENRRISEEAMIRLLAVLCLIFVLEGCAGDVTGACPDPDPNPISPCATSHSHTYDGGGRP